MSLAADSRRQTPIFRRLDRAGSGTRTFFYDGAGELSSTTQPESGTTDYEYTENGLLSKKIDGRSQYVIYGYDNADRVSSKTYALNSGNTVSPITPGAGWTYYGVDETCTGTSINCTGLLKKAEVSGTTV